MDGRLWSLGGGTGELALDKRSAGDRLTSLFLVGGRELGCEAAQERVREEEDVEDIVDDGLDDDRELPGEDEKDSDSRRSHLRDVDDRECAEAMQADVGVSWEKVDSFAGVHVCWPSMDSSINGGVLELNATGRWP